MTPTDLQREILSTEGDLDHVRTQLREEVGEAVRSGEFIADAVLGAFDMDSDDDHHRNRML